MGHPLFSAPCFLLVSKTSVPIAGREIFSHHQLIWHKAHSHSGTQVEWHLRPPRPEPPRMLEFDTSDALAARVATGVCVAITPPLCLHQGAARIESVELMPLLGPGFSRELTFHPPRERVTTASEACCLARAQGGMHNVEPCRRRLIRNIARGSAPVYEQDLRPIHELPAWLLPLRRWRSSAFKPFKPTATCSARRPWEIARCARREAVTYNDVLS
ncbi:hypothetical protein EN808_28800 [Mesorhizobium sp. M8A.F.Ca.ET.165.01.1.1]|nr:hypothetical protein EN850_28290 [Mesorhizobium sp. M8A.F.Ca.ET.207.01.1.1]TGS39124.1 hypothetical protein EN825_27995 [Mesorhizobium sp. M8A.F.Ca.ET.182.01.1.1]TGS77406.1 hypothetical protein EN824_28230 [Mesorhizobium sp. M8A.F.Ca.ET.181.01.1.1]TGT36384.1 hypothetical protein EN808_28800 [Mesorhizobium sp. M8A.F.Ca.ET.165.01.1.1]